MNWIKQKTQLGMTYISEDRQYKIYSVPNTKNSSQKEYTLMLNDELIFRSEHLKDCQAFVDAKESPYNIDNATMNYALNMLNVQYQHHIQKPNSAEQKAYYDGMFAMLNVLISKGYTNDNTYVYRNEEDRHKIGHKN